MKKTSKTKFIPQQYRLFAEENQELRLQRGEWPVYESNPAIPVQKGEHFFKHFVRSHVRRSHVSPSLIQSIKEKVRFV